MLNITYIKHYMLNITYLWYEILIYSLAYF